MHTLLYSHWGHLQQHQLVRKGFSANLFISGIKTNKPSLPYHSVAITSPVKTPFCCWPCAEGRNDHPDNFRRMSLGLSCHPSHLVSIQTIRVCINRVHTQMAALGNKWCYSATHQTSSSALLMAQGIKCPEMDLPQNLAHKTNKEYDCPWLHQRWLGKSHQSRSATSYALHTKCLMYAFMLSDEQ